ncbi:alpha/beta hydrolase [sulfur-oxidizing endosymbiont of Gigantopelta aegis]|uniref:alpha/beta hydrolase n=1 Tax=sulfur-oxidizing endosymbiont of Gigantopelta aegis TaxID=2794934 RepID=UPI001BE49A98|nr:alpha/beta hydrolase [sulfur-oxidizing endosymbiont of Gigantopelta aegis]
MTLSRQSFSQSNYAYPIQNPIAATVIGTPDALKITIDDLYDWQPDYVDMPSSKSQFKQTVDEEYKLTLFPKRYIPPVFWYERGGLKYSIAQQNIKAPLIFIIAGTGASYRSGTVKALQKVFYQIGYHAVALSSPTIPNFMYNASTSIMPGNLEEDGADLYRVMQAIMKQHKNIQVSDYYLTGYSLGASHAAFITRLDEQKKTEQKAHFQFKKTLLINPPLSLLSSVDELDDMFEDNIPGGINNFNQFFQRFIGKVSDYYQQNEQLGLGKEFLYKIFQEHPPTEEEMKVMIGFVFRIASAGMIFGADVYNHQGYIVPKNKVSSLTASSSLSKYSKVAHRLGFKNYIQNVYLPNFKKKTGLSEQQLIEQSSLESIKGYLQQAKNITMMHNLDDPILKSGEIETLISLFPDRTIIYPHGGHLGNIEFKQNVLDMVKFFQSDALKRKSSSDKISMHTAGEMQ